MYQYHCPRGPWCPVWLCVPPGREEQRGLKSNCALPAALCALARVGQPRLRHVGHLCKAVLPPLPASRRGCFLAHWDDVSQSSASSWPWAWLSRTQSTISMVLTPCQELTSNVKGQHPTARVSSHRQRHLQTAGHSGCSADKKVVPATAASLPSVRPPPQQPHPRGEDIFLAQALSHCHGLSTPVPSLPLPLSPPPSPNGRE